MGIGDWIVSNVLWILLGIATTFNCFWLIQHKEKLRINEAAAAVLAVLHMICGVLSIKIFAYMEGQPGGMSLYGGMFFLPVLFYLVARVTKRNVAETFDVFTIPTIVAFFCGRLNCLFSGCCLGTVIPGTDGQRWPTRELELVLYVVLFLALRNKIGKSKYKGKLYPIYMVSYGAFRFIIEWFRQTENMVGFAHLSHIWSIVAIAVGCLVIVLIDKKLVKLGEPKVKNNRGSGRR